MEGVAQIGALITSQVISRSINDDVTRVSSTSLVTTTLLTPMVEYLSKKRKNNRKSNNQRQNKYKLFKIMILLTVGYFLVV